MSQISRTPDAPYYAVIFTSRRTDTDPEGYEKTARRMEELAAQQPGFLGLESARNMDGPGVTVSYWESLEAIRMWKVQVEHLAAQERGKSTWYQAYAVRIAKVERAYGTEI